MYRHHRLVARSLDRQNTESRIDPKFVATDAQFQTRYRASRGFEQIVQIFYPFFTPSPRGYTFDLIHDQFAACRTISDLCCDTAVTMVADRGPVEWQAVAFRPQLLAVWRLRPNCLCNVEASLLFRPRSGNVCAATPVARYRSRPESDRNVDELELLIDKSARDPARSNWFLDFEGVELTSRSSGHIDHEKPA